MPGAPGIIHAGFDRRGISSTALDAHPRAPRSLPAGLLSWRRKPALRRRAPWLRVAGGAGILTGCPSPTPPARPRLRAASPHADQRRVGTLRLAADGHSHPSFATRAGIRTRVRLHRACRPDFSGHPTLPYPGSCLAGCPARQEPATASVAGLAPLHFQRRRARPVSCYTLLGG